jgi:hypothetical protein
VTTARTGSADAAGAPEVSGQVQLYYDQVVAALSGLAPGVRQDLLEDLPDHLAEVAAEISAEGSGSLRERLGEPEVYALELQAAAGLEPTEPAAVLTGMADRLRGAAELGRRFDLQAGRLVGYPRLRDLLAALRPGWWVLRGWLAAELVAGAHDRESWSGFIPDIGGSWVLGLLLTLALISASVALGQRSLDLSAWARRAVAAGSVLLAVWGVGVLATNVGGTAYAYSGAEQGYSTPYSEIADVYVYDQAGQLVNGARLYDQNGNPIQLGAGYCPDGRPAPGANPVFSPPVYPGAAIVWSYPLCPAYSGPFRSGPPPLTPNSSPSPSDTPQPSGAASSAVASTPAPATTAVASPPAPSTTAGTAKPSSSPVKPSTVKPSTAQPTATSSGR